MWNLRSQVLKQWYLGQELYIRVYDPDPNPAKERQPPSNLLYCGLYYYLLSFLFQCSFLRLWKRLLIDYFRAFRIGSSSIPSTCTKAKSGATKAVSRNNAINKLVIFLFIFISYDLIVFSFLSNLSFSSLCCYSFCILLIFTFVLL